MKNRRFILGILVLVLVFFVFLSACQNTEVDSNVTVEQETVEQGKVTFNFYRYENKAIELPRASKIEESKHTLISVKKESFDFIDFDSNAVIVHQEIICLTEADFLKALAGNAHIYTYGDYKLDRYRQRRDYRNHPYPTRLILLESVTRHYVATGEVKKIKDKNGNAKIFVKDMVYKVTRKTSKEEYVYLPVISRGCCQEVRAKFYDSGDTINVICVKIKFEPTEGYERYEDR